MEDFKNFKMFFSGPVKVANCGYCHFPFPMERPNSVYCCSSCAAKAKKLQDKEAFKKYIKNPKNRFKHKIRLQTLALYRKGKIEKTPCIFCGEEKTEFHHTSYRSPESVVCVCKKHHELVHSKL